MDGIKTVILDGGHGGEDPGAVYQGRQEKDDNLQLVFDIGYELEQKGIPVLYTRVDDTYDSPMEKAQIASESGADYFVSIHRNATELPGSASGIMSLVYPGAQTARLMAEKINQELEKTGFEDLGIIDRPGLVVLKKTEMPAVLVEVGFLDNEKDNELLDRKQAAIAQAIADGIIAAIQEEEASQPEYYRVQVGAYRNEELARDLLNRLLEQGFPAYLVKDGDYYKVRVGAFLNLDYAAEMEKKLRSYGYSTYLVL